LKICARHRRKRRTRRAQTARYERDDGPLSAAFLRALRHHFVGGMCAAILVFLAAAPDRDPDITGYRLVGGHVFQVKRTDSLRAIRTLQSVGGSASADATELDDWIGALWHGRRLCYMLVVAKFVLAGMCTGAARAVAGDLAQ
jgi:hypothetical protein